MNAKTFALLGCVTIVGLLGCTTEPDPGKVAAVPAPVPNPRFVYTYRPQSELPKNQFYGQPCLIGSAKSCMDLDSRPFEPCLVTTKSCGQKGAETEQIAPAILVDRYAEESR